MIINCEYDVMCLLKSKEQKIQCCSVMKRKEICCTTKPNKRANE